MTRQAEPVTIKVDDDPVIWAPRGSFVASDEVRAVMPEHFLSWYERERLQVASRMARWLRLASGPMPISTALRLAVRLSLRGTEMRRKWVAFSVVEEPFLRGRRFPDAEIQPVVDGVVRFSFSENEPPLATAATLAVVPCGERSGISFYPQRAVASRRIVLAHPEH